MAWDDDKATGDDLTSSEWDNHVADQKTRIPGDPSEIKTGTLANRPVAGTANLWYFTTDNNGVYYDDGTSWFLISEHPGNISASDLGFDTATQTELDNHAGTAGAHHTRYSDSEALQAAAAAWQPGDEVILETTISPGFDTSTSSTSFVDLTTMPERGTMDWSKYHAIQDNVQQFDVMYGQYRVDAPLTLRVSYFGNGESGASKTDATYSSNAYRVTNRWTISDITNYGVWTPNFRAKSEDGSTIRVRGGGTLMLIAVT